MASSKQFRNANIADRAICDITRLFLKVVIVFVFIFSNDLCLAKSGAAHIADITDILFNQERTVATKELAAFVSQGMDMGSGIKPVDLAEKGSSFLNSLRKEFGSLKGIGEHREFAHWGMNSSIPEEFLNAMERVYPGSKERVVELWRQFVVTRREAVKQALNLSGPNSDRAAQAIASMIDDIHVFGDHTTKATVNLRSIENTFNDFIKSLNRLLGNNNDISRQIRAEYKLIPSGISEGARSDCILKILKKYNVDFSSRATHVLARMGYTGVVFPIDHKALKQITGRVPTTFDIAKHWSLELMDDLKQRLKKSNQVRLYGGLKESYNCAIDKASRRMAERAYQTFDNVYSPAALKSMTEVKNCRTVVGVLQEVTMKDGSQKLVLSIPVENFAKGIKSGIGDGVMTFVFSEGATLYQFARGDISQEDFCWESAKNCSAAMLSGGATFVAVVLGAAPTGWVVMGIGIGSYMLCDIAFTEIRRMVDGPSFTIDDILGELPTEIQRRKTLFDYSGYDSLLAYRGEESILDYHGADSMFELPSDSSAFDFKSNDKSLFDLQNN